jgi:hypothetical protein
VSSVGEKFLAAFGAPDPATASGLNFSRRLDRELWADLHGEIGSGWFRDGFLYLFGADLDALRPCLEAWSFLVPPIEDRMILGRNACGAILVLDNANDVPQRVFILDPFTSPTTGTPRRSMQRRSPDCAMDLDGRNCTERARCAPTVTLPRWRAVSTPRAKSTST